MHSVRTIYLRPSHKREVHRVGLDVQTSEDTARFVDSRPRPRCEWRSRAHRGRGKSTVSFPASSARVSRCEPTAYRNGRARALNITSCGRRWRDLYDITISEERACGCQRYNSPLRPTPRATAATPSPSLRCCPGSPKGSSSCTQGRRFAQGAM